MATFRNPFWGKIYGINEDINTRIFIVALIQITLIANVGKDYKEIKDNSWEWIHILEHIYMTKWKDLCLLIDSLMY